MRGTFRPRREVARMTLRLEATGAATSVTVTDVMLQPGGAVSGWLPHVTELPWTAGIIGGGLLGGTVDQEALERLAQLEQLTIMQADILQQLGVDVDQLKQSGGIDQQAIFDAFVQARGGA